MRSLLGWPLIFHDNRELDLAWIKNFGKIEYKLLSIIALYPKKFNKKGLLTYSNPLKFLVAGQGFEPWTFGL